MSSPSIINNNIFVSISTVVLLLIGAGCSKNNRIHLGKEIPSDAVIVALSSVIETPEEFNGKTVILKGLISGQCPSYCEFFFKEGTHRVTIFPQGFSFPKLPIGKPVTVLAEITAGSENIVFSALGIKVG